MFFRQSFVRRYVILVGLLVYVLGFVGFLQLQQSPTVDVGNRQAGDAAAVQSVSKVTVVPRDADGGPTPAAVAAALRSPLSMRTDGGPVRAKLPPDGGDADQRPHALAQSSKTSRLPTSVSTTTTKKPLEGAARLDAVGGNLTLHKENVGDALKYFKAGLGQEPKGDDGHGADDRSNADAANQKKVCIIYGSRCLFVCECGMDAIRTEMLSFCESDDG